MATKARVIKNFDFMEVSYLTPPTELEMLDALGKKEEVFHKGWTIRRCRHCKTTPVAGGPTACDQCLRLRDLGLTREQKRQLKFGRESAFFDGHIDEVTVWDGHIVFSNNFIPPTEEYDK